MPVSRSRTARYEPMERLKTIERTMRAYFVVLRAFGRTRAATPEELYGFRALDVSELHFYKAGVGRGVWYRLKNGRVFDSKGRRSRRHRAAYLVRPPKRVKTIVTLDPPVAKISQWTQVRDRNSPIQQGKHYEKGRRPIS